MIDPNPKVSGAGVDALSRAGVAVEVGLLEPLAQQLNEAFSKWVTQRIPFASLKVAQTLDGRVATSAGESKWITGPQARALGHSLRAEADAILTGVGTALA